jgi:hypothetical protein
MGKSIQYARLSFLFLALVFSPTSKFAIAAEATSQVAPNSPVSNDPPSGEGIPTGFKVERYVRVWEHNPFTLVAPSVPQAEHSVFEKLFLTSWLKDGRKDLVFIQNMETNEVQKITSDPNQDNLRLIALHLDPNPHLVEALLSDGKEQGSVRFRLDAPSSGAEQTTPVAQVTTARPGSNQAQTASRPLEQPQPGASAVTAPGDRPQGGRLNPTSRAAQMNGGSGRARRRSGSEANHLPSPQQ